MLRALAARLGIRHQLWALFGLFLLTGATVLLLDEFAQYRARESLLALRGQSLLGVREIKNVSDAYGLDVIGVTFRTRNYLIGWEEGVTALDAARVEIDQGWATLARLPRTDIEQTHFEAAERERAPADEAMTQLRAILVKKDIRALGRFADTRLFPAIDPVTARLQLLSNLATARADAVVETNLRDNRRVSALRIGLSLGALLLVALIGRIVLRNAYRGVESLTFLARRMRQHDYTAEPRYLPRGGELGTVMDAFLEMRCDVLGFETELTQQLARNEHTRAELERRELFQRSLLESAQVAILAMDGQGRWTVFNSFAERLLGWRAEDVVGRVPRHAGSEPQPDDAPLMISRESAQRIIDQLSQKLGRPVRHDWEGMYEMAELRQPPAESRLLHKDGHEVPVLLALAALHDEDGRRTGLIAVATDLTEREQLEADLRESEARAQAASHAKSSFLAAMSHEIRTPMIGVTGMLEVLAHSKLDTDQRHAINVIQQSSQSLLQIIGDILDFSKIEAGRLEISPTIVSLESVVRSTVANYTGAASSKGLNLTCQVDDRVGVAHHRADALRLRQILGNFLSNAIKFTATGHVEVALEWTGESAPGPDAPMGGDLLSFRVSDTGIGVDAQAQQRLFQPFSQAHQDTTREYGGTGLGLAICTRLAELMGGMVTMASAPGAGTTMRLNLTLPRAPQEAPSPEAVSLTRPAQFVPRPLPDVAQAERERSLVLLADDHPTNRMVIARQLALAGYASEPAQDGVQALERWRSGRYALVLSDVHMPLMDGYALATAIRAEEAARGLPRTPVVALTASALKGEAERCLAAGMDDYLAKPVAVPVLAACLQRWLPHTAPDARDDAAAAAHPDAAAAGGLPQLDMPQVLDPAALAEFGDDAHAQAAVLRDFLDTTAQDLHALTQARDHVDTAALMREAHKIKGAARLVGAGELAQAASELESAGPQGDWSALLPLVTQVETAVQRLGLFVASRYPA